MTSFVNDTQAMPLPMVRMRRLRANAKLRQLTAEHHLSIEDLVLPLFIKEGLTQKQAIGAMPGHYQLTLDDVPAEVAQIQALGIPAVMLFGVPAHKDAKGSAALQQDSIVAQAIGRIKQQDPQLLVMADLCFCEYTDHGHCGAIDSKNIANPLDNDQTLMLLKEQAVVLAQAGADVIAPSGNVDGMVAAIRFGLDQAGFQAVPILSYAAKYASAFYGPFREAAEGAPQFGDRRGYQMDPANGDRAVRECQLDLDEGADMLMVKPAHTYLDVLHRVKQQFPAVPLAAYQVSGEFAMLKAAAERGWLDHDKTMLESLLAIKRAGADFIISYFAKEVAALLSPNCVTDAQS